MSIKRHIVLQVGNLANGQLIIYCIGACALFLPSKDQFKVFDKCLNSYDFCMELTWSVHMKAIT